MELELKRAKFIGNNTDMPVYGFDEGKEYACRDFGRGIEVYYEGTKGTSLAMGYSTFSSCFNVIGMWPSKKSTKKLKGKTLYKVGDVLKFTYADDKRKSKGFMKVSRITEEAGIFYYYDEIKQVFIDELDVEGKLEGDKLIQYNKELKEYLRLKKKFEL